MQLVEILTFLDRLSLEQRGRRLEPIERDILAIAWDNKPYQDITGYEEQTVKNKASFLWKYLSQLLNTKVNKRNIREVLINLNVGGILSPTSNLVTTTERVSAPQGGREVLCQGRQVELFQLQQWIEVDRCKLIFVCGMKGIGKSYIAQKIAKLLSADIDYLVWVDLEKPVPLMALLSIVIKKVGSGRSSKLSHDLSRAIDKTIGYLQKNRCLLILENADTIFGNNRVRTTENADRLIAEYDLFFNRLNAVEHNSCCLMILEEKVLKFDLDYQQLEIGGLDWISCQTILKNRGLAGSSTDWKILVKKYHGNLHYLNSIVPTIQNVFGGSISKFLDANVLVYDRIEESIVDSIEKLSEQEMFVVIYLANHSQGIILDRLKDVFRQMEYRDLLRSIDKLTRKYLIELREDRFVLSELVAEYSRDRYLAANIDRDPYISIRITSNG